jgi:hypothetical protein
MGPHRPSPIASPSFASRLSCAQRCASYFFLIADFDENNSRYAQNGHETKYIRVISLDMGDPPLCPHACRLRETEVRVIGEIPYEGYLSFFGVEDLV